MLSFAQSNEIEPAAQEILLQCATDLQTETANGWQSL